MSRLTGVDTEVIGSDLDLYLTPDMVDQEMSRGQNGLQAKYFSPFGQHSPFTCVF